MTPRSMRDGGTAMKKIIEYELTDAYMRSMKIDRFEIQWDGEKMTFPNDEAWTGSFSSVEDGEM